MSQDLTELITAFYEQPTSKGLEALGTTFIFTTLTAFYISDALEPAH